MRTATDRNREIRRELEARREEKFAKFARSLLPGEERLIGVRLPVLRKMARRIAAEDWREYLQTAREDSFEEIMLQGMVIGCVKADFHELVPYLRAFVPKIDNWSLCDSFCIGLKLTRDYREEMWTFLQPYLHARGEFEVRFAVVMLLDFYVDKDNLSRVLAALDQVSHTGYYVKMAVAWAVSMCFAAFPEETAAYLTRCRLDEETYHKAIQKITESRQVSQEAKERIRTLKRERL